MKSQRFVSLLLLHYKGQSHSYTNSKRNAKNYAKIGLSSFISRHCTTHLVVTVVSATFQSTHCVPSVAKELRQKT